MVIINKIKNKIIKIKKLILKHLKKIIIVNIVLILFFSCFAFFINPVITSTIELKTKSLTSKAINSAIAEVSVDSVLYDDLVNIITDDLGNISMIQANSLEINNLSKDLARATEEKIVILGKNGIFIPIGTFSGMPILVGRGPKVNIKMNPLGVIHCSFTSKFESAGINQTNHKIYLNIFADVGVVLPLKTQKFKISQQVLLCESIIVGQVPEVYLYSDQLDTLLNFVPY